jgi:sigma-B regulation protein RsbU (phosphoserine phosphatase)
VNCGHVPAIIAQAGLVTHVDDGDMPVGLITEAGFHEIDRELGAGARLCILTDGISETENAEGAEFGTAIVADCLRGAEPVREILAAVESFAAGAEAQDDRTLVVLERIK